MAPKLNQPAAAEASADSYLPSVVVFNNINSSFRDAIQKLKPFNFIQIVIILNEKNIFKNTFRSDNIENRQNVHSVNPVSPSNANDGQKSLNHEKNKVRRVK